MHALLVTQPLTRYMDEISLVETVRHRFHLKSKGLSLSHSQCSCEPEDLQYLNSQFVLGNRARDVIFAYGELLQAPPNDPRWMPFLSVDGLGFCTCLSSIVKSMCDAWRRLLLPTQFMPWQIFKIACPEWTPTKAADFLDTLKQKHCACEFCSDCMFAAVIFRWLQSNGGSNDGGVGHLQAVARLQKLLRDLLLELPVSSVQVEKQHANLQLDSGTNRIQPRRLHTIQTNSYLLSTVLEHKSLLASVEAEQFGRGSRRCHISKICTYCKVMYSRIVLLAVGLTTALTATAKF